MTSAQVHQAIAAYFTAMSTMNQERWVENFTPDAVIYDPVGNPPSRAIEDSGKFFGLLSMVFARLELTQDFVSVVGDRAAVKWTMYGWAKNGKQGTAEGISVFKLQAGKIQQVSSYWDDAAMMAQLKD
jgi:ketosteroid isomerase-like protein